MSTNTQNEITITAPACVKRGEFFTIKASAVKQDPRAPDTSMQNSYNWYLNKEWSMCTKYGRASPLIEVVNDNKSNTKSCWLQAPNFIVDDYKITITKNSNLDRTCTLIIKIV